jgi:hypothetical protein
MSLSVHVSSDEVSWSRSPGTPTPALSPLRALLREALAECRLLAVHPPAVGAAAQWKATLHQPASTARICAACCASSTSSAMAKTPATTGSGAAAIPSASASRVGWSRAENR